MGSGKSTIGRLLAERLGVVFCDLDTEISRHFQASIPEIFRTHGEAAFRRVEATELQRHLSTPTPLVLAAGGGIVTEADSRSAIQTQSLCLFLHPPFGELLTRLQQAPDSRPLAAGISAEELRKLYDQRLLWYQQIAHATFSDTQAPPTLVTTIHTWLTQHTWSTQP
jgi:shikimate kinase